MDLVFKHLEHRCEQGQLSGAWATLLHTFEQSILDTHRSKFTQYLLWYLCRQASRPFTLLSSRHWRAACPSDNIAHAFLLSNLPLCSD